MFSFFDQVASILEAVFRYFVNLVESLVMAVWFLFTSLSFPTQLVPYMPAIIGTAIPITLAVCVIKFLVGR